MYWEIHLIRALRILGTLGPVPISAAELARDLRVSEATIYRYVKALRRANIAICGRRGDGYWIAPDGAMRLIIDRLFGREPPEDC